jgi:hypothetical protein
MTIYAPGEPFVDANGNGRYDPEEYFLDLTYPNAADSAQYRKNGMRREQGTTFKRKVPAASASVGGRYETGVNVYGVLYTNGTYDATGNFVHYGAVVTKGGMAGSAGTPEIYFDERLVSGGWPPPEIQIPRTMISAWETEN